MGELCKIIKSILKNSTTGIYIQNYYYMTFTAILCNTNF